MATIRRRHNNVLRFNSCSRCYVVATWMFLTVMLLLLLLFQATIAVHFSVPAFEAHDAKRLLSSWQTIPHGGSTDSIDSNNNLPLTTITATNEQENDTDDTDIMLVVDAFQKEIDVMVAKYRQSVQKTFESLQHDFQKQFAKQNTDNNKSSATVSAPEQLGSNKLDWEYEKDLIKDDDYGRIISPKVDAVTEIGTITGNEIVDTIKEKQDDDDVFVGNLPLAVNNDSSAPTNTIDWFPIPKWFSIPFFDSATTNNNDNNISLSSSSSMDASNEATGIDDVVIKRKSFNETAVVDGKNGTTNASEELEIGDGSSTESNNRNEETTAITWFTLPKWLSVPFLDTKNASTATAIINEDVDVRNDFATVEMNLTIITNNDSLSSNFVTSTTNQSVSDLIAVENLSTADTNNHTPPSSSIVYDFYTKNIGKSLSTTRNRFLSLFHGSKEEQAVIHSSSSNSNQVILENDAVHDDEVVARSLIEPPENTFGTTTTNTKTNKKKRTTSIISKNKKKKTKTKHKLGTNMAVSSRIPTKVEDRRRGDNEIDDLQLASSTATDDDDDLSTSTTSTYVKPIKLKQKQVTSTTTAFAAFGNNKSSTKNNMFLDTKQLLNTMLKGTTIRKEVRYVMKVILFTVLYFVLNITIQLLAKMIIMKVKK